LKNLGVISVPLAPFHLLLEGFSEIIECPFFCRLGKVKIDIGDTERRPSALKLNRKSFIS